MLKDIQMVISKCEECQRNQKEVAVNSPTIKVNGINDMIGIDLVFGCIL